MMKWMPYELHTHTNHSDGVHTLEELAQSAKELGLAGIAMTDHNTISTFGSIDAAANKFGINIIKGLEWTTFFGHVLLVGINKYIDWRDISLENISSKIKEARKSSELIGIAHPYRMGGAVATGCYFEYTIEEWQDIDYIEVWSNLLPSEKQMNTRAFELWTKLLNQGYKISAVSGRDWHKSTPQDKFIAATYIGLQNYEVNTSANIIKAMKKGVMTVGFGYRIINEIEKGGNIYSIGDYIENHDLTKKLKIKINIEKSSIDCKSDINSENLIVKINSNIGELYRGTVIGESTFNVEVENNKNFIWLRSELYEKREKDELLIAFTNPIYLQKPTEN